MEQQYPRYVMAFQEEAGIENHNFVSKAYAACRVCAWIACALIFLLSYLPDSPFDWRMRVIAILTGAVLFFIKPDESVPSSIAVMFFEDRVVIFRERHYYSATTCRKEYEVFRYENIHKVQYDSRANTLTFSGSATITYYEYGKNGMLPDKPIYKDIRDSTCVIHTGFEQGRDFAKEIEVHSPLKVNVIET